MLKVSDVPAGLAEVGRKLYWLLAATETAGLPDTLVEAGAASVVAAGLAESPLAVDPPQPARTAVTVNTPKTCPRPTQFRSMFISLASPTGGNPVAPLSRTLSARDRRLCVPASRRVCPYLRFQLTLREVQQLRVRPNGHVAKQQLSACLSDFK